MSIPSSFFMKLVKAFYTRSYSSAQEVEEIFQILSLSSKFFTSGHEAQDDTTAQCHKVKIFVRAKECIWISGLAAPL